MRKKTRPRPFFNSRRIARISELTMSSQPDSTAWVAGPFNWFYIVNPRVYAMRLLLKTPVFSYSYRRSQALNCAPRNPTIALSISNV